MLVEDIFKNCTQLLPKGWSLKSAKYSPEATYRWEVTIQNDEDNQDTVTGYNIRLFKAFQSAAAMVRLPHEE